VLAGEGYFGEDDLKAIENFLVGEADEPVDLLT
jgi:hypothetical protein